jgi:YVTN family beta-propeller protein
MGYNLGVDLGTTFTAAAVDRDGRIEMLTLADRTVVTPSVVFARQDGVMITGDAAARRAVTDPGRIGREFKRRLGDPTPLVLGGAPYSATDLLGCLLHDVIRQATDTEGASPDQVVLTRPANWGPYRRELFDEVPRLAGLDQARTVTEPEAAAAYYAAERNLADDEVVAVYDLGGGTFDATVVRKLPDGIEILGSPEGIERLGGIDFDEAVLARVDYQTGGAVAGLNPQDPQATSALRRLREDCTEAKETLSVDTETIIPVFLPDRHGEVKLTRAEFEDMVRAPVESTIVALRRALRSAEIEPGDLAAVVLVGGSSRIPLVARMVSEEFGRPIAVNTHPKYAVALGATALAVTGRPESIQVVASPPEPAAPAATLSVAQPAADPVAAESLTVDADADTAATTPPDGGAAGMPPPPLSRHPALANGKRRRRHVALLTTGVFSAIVGLLLALGVINLSSGQAPADSVIYPRASTSASAVTPVTSNVTTVAPSTATVASISVAPPTPIGASRPTPEVSSTIGVAAPQGLAVAPDGKHAYVTSVGASRVSVIDLATGAVTASILLPQPPQYVAVAPDSRHAYVSCWVATGDTNVVAVIDTATNAATAYIPVGKHPYSLAVTPDGRQVYVPDHNSAEITIIDTATNTVTATVPVKANPHWIVFSSDARTAYVADHESNVVSVIDTTSRTVTTTVPVPKSPHSVALAPDGKHLVVASIDANSASVIDTASNKVTATIGVGTSPRGAAFAPDGRHAYVVNDKSNSLSVIDVGAGQVSATVPVGNSPAVVALTPDGRRAYVTNTESNSLSVLTAAD